jgi:RNA polymerase sigma factor (sigma-70 family)
MYDVRPKRMSQAGVFPDDPGLLMAFREGRREALEMVYLLHVRLVEQNLRAMARARGLTELSQASVVADLLQDVFVRAFSDDARRAYDGVREYRKYLGAIARNCFIDLWRSRSREVLTSPDDLKLETDSGMGAADSYDPRVAAVLARYIADLRITLKGVYEQRFVLERSQDEAAAALGLSRRSLRTGEERLRRGLRKALRKAGISLDEVRPRGGPVAAALAPAGVVAAATRGGS